MPVPPGWEDQQALGLVVNWPTALAALKPPGGIAAGQTVLIHAAASATGQAAVRMAKHDGARVIATASPAPAWPQPNRSPAGSSSTAWQVATPR
ncbi:hypothetical protein ACIBG0_04880 [Nocardia sp. NPDC050630]|uniref:hypothetical protein n=1 Tax=Nocardia sp. NPDC050630 TaxID=3364321 RepID=UPI00378F37AA